MYQNEISHAACDCYLLEDDQSFPKTFKVVVRAEILLRDFLQTPVNNYL